MTLAELLGPPRTLTRAGREWAVAELTLADVAALESWAADQAPSPWEGLEAMDAEGDEGLRLRGYQALHSRAEHWPPHLGSQSSRAALGAAAGLVAFAWVALKRGQPGLTLDDAAAAACEMTPEEWGSLRRAAWGEHPLDALIPRIDPEQAEDDEAEPPNWGKALAWLAETNGFTAEDVGRLTLAQYGAYVRQGEPRSFGKMLQPGEDYEERRARRQRLFGGGYASPPPPSSSPAPPGPP
jgi:hypothetical protein